MGIVAALLKSPEQLHRLRAAIRGRYLVTPCDGWDAVRRLCDTEPVSLAVLDLYADGSMAKILKKWQLSAAALK